MKRSIPILTAVLVVAGTAASAQDSETPLTVEDVPQGVLKYQLGLLGPQAKATALTTLSERRRLLHDVASLRVNTKGMVCYVCSLGGQPIDNTPTAPIQSLELAPQNYRINKAGSVAGSSPEARGV